MKSIAILGAGGHGKVIAEIAQDCGWQKIDFYDDSGLNTDNFPFPIKGDTANLIENLKRYDATFVAIGNNLVRSEKIASLSRLPISIATLIHPSAYVSRTATLGKGIVVMPNSIINAYSSLGDGCIVNSGACVEHECKLGLSVHVSPGACLAGNVSIGDFSWIGIGSSINNNLFVGAGVDVAAGATVINNVADSVMVAGVPAVVKKNV